MYKYKAKIINIIDGDTFDLDIDLGFHIHIHERVRILNIDTPEKRGSQEKELGLIVTEFAKSNFLGKDIVINSKEELSPKTDSFGRWLVEMWFDDTSIEDIYNNLGVNKLNENYSVDNVMKLKSL